jgi:hypothetical protein
MAGFKVVQTAGDYPSHMVSKVIYSQATESSLLFQDQAMPHFVAHRSTILKLVIFEFPPATLAN